MKRFRMTRTDWADLLAGEAEEGRRRIMSDDIDERPDCRAEAEAIDRLLRETEAVRSEIREASASVNWDALPALIADRAMAADRRVPGHVSGAGPRAWLAAFRLRPALAGLSAGLLVGAAAMYFVLRAPGTRPGRESSYYASGEFLDRAELEMARRNTLDYLEKSQYVLLDVFDAAGQGTSVPAAVRSERARDLLQRKRYLNAQLERVQMAKAKAICDQIEMLFRELALIGDDLPAAEIRRIQSVVEERQLFLKINLVKKELQSGV